VTAAAYLIDLYDTLVVSDWYLWRDRLASRLGLDAQVVSDAYSATRPARSVGAYPDAEADVVAVLRAASVEPDPALVTDLAREETTYFTRATRLFDDSLPAVRALRTAGAAVALVSNCSNNTRPTIVRLGLDDEFDAVVLSFEVGSRKPEPAIYQHALDRLGARGTDAVFVDDQAAYCDGARALGMDTRLIIRRGVIPPEGVSDTDGHQVITDLTALL